jgi:hypothetical protein
MFVPELEWPGQIEIIGASTVAALDPTTSRSLTAAIRQLIYLAEAP